MGTFELTPASEGQEYQQTLKAPGLGSTMLLSNARWFTRVRWMVVAVFVAVGAVGLLVPGALASIGLDMPGIWLLGLAGILVLGNIGFIVALHRLGGDASRRSVKTTIWLQIGVDLVVVTALVHLIGSTDTFIAFTYLFHIALACIFFPQVESFLVTLLAGGLYLATVLLEISGFLYARSILEEGLLLSQRSPVLQVVYACSAVFVWMVVWYLVSTLSEAVRRRDLQLRSANQELRRANQEKNQQMLLTTHDLKAPFVDIESNIHVLKYQFWNEIPPPVQAIIDQIHNRSKTLRERINEILLLGNLKSKGPEDEETTSVDVKEVLELVSEELGEKAREKQITVDMQVPSFTLNGNRDNLKTLFSNLVANAISYSYEGGKVRVWGEDRGNEARVVIADRGIGIRDEVLPHIFEEYFRSREATRINRMSTGLGLSIVKEIARKWGMRVRVTSEPGNGSTFEVIIPACSPASHRRGNT
jgi:signal transduction histidine kinase